jgi:Endodeoxyribonuclease RusA
MSTICFTVLGEPMSKGSMIGEVVTRGDGSVVYKNGKPLCRVRPAKKGLTRNAQGIGNAALAARAKAGLGISRGEAVAVTLRFFTGRPAAHFGTGRNAGLLKDSAPAKPAKRPDVDKWARQVLDAMTGVIYADDGQVVSLLAVKDFAVGDGPPRTEIEVSVLPEQTVGVIVADSQLALVA